MDMINSLNLLNNDGLILCDDIQKSKKNATWKTINLLNEEKNN